MENFDLSEESPKESFPWIPVVVGVIVLGLAALWIAHSKSENKSRLAVVSVLERELDMDQAALQAQKDKVVQLSQELEALKADIQAGQVKNHKAAVAEYNKKAAEQRTAREQWITMANQYNEKVARLRKLQ